MKKGIFVYFSCLFLPASLLYAGAPIQGEPPPAASDSNAAAPVVFNVSELDPASPTGGCTADEGGAGCRPVCEPCGPPGRIWIDAEYLYWWTKGMNVPPLVTSGSAAAPIAGALGEPGTSVLSGSSFDRDGQSGARFTVGAWLDDCQTKGFEVSYFFLGTQTDSFTSGGSGAPGSVVIARPFLDVTGPGAPFQNSEIVAFPGVSSGTVTVHSSSEFQGAAANGLCNLCCSCGGDCKPGYRLDLVYGFTWMQLNEDLSVAENITVLPGAAAPLVSGSVFNVYDGFRTQNNFYGGQIGVRGEWWRNRFFVNGTALVALGDNNEQVIRNGFTGITAPTGVTTVNSGGLLVQPSNSGTINHNEFSVIPQIGVNVGYQLTDHIRAYIGYTFLYWSEVARPGDQIDFAVNTSQVPRFGGPGVLVGEARPAPIVNQSDFWAQGINVGVEIRY